MAKQTMVIEKELVSTMVEEWTEWRVYANGKRIASFHTEREAKKFVKAA